MRREEGRGWDINIFPLSSPLLSDMNGRQP